MGDGFDCKSEVPSVRAGLDYCSMSQHVRFQRAFGGRRSSKPAETVVGHTCSPQCRCKNIVAEQGYR